MIKIEVVHTFGDRPLTGGDVMALAEWAEKLELEMPERELLTAQISEEEDVCDE